MSPPTSRGGAVAGPCGCEVISAPTLIDSWGLNATSVPAWGMPSQVGRTDGSRGRGQERRVRPLPAGACRRAEGAAPPTAGSHPGSRRRHRRGRVLPAVVRPPLPGPDQRPSGRKPNPRGWGVEALPAKAWDMPERHPTSPPRGVEKGSAALDVSLALLTTSQGPEVMTGSPRWTLSLSARQQPPGQSSCPLGHSSSSTASWA